MTFDVTFYIEFKEVIQYRMCNLKKNHVLYFKLFWVILHRQTNFLKYVFTRRVRLNKVSNWYNFKWTLTSFPYQNIKI